MTSSTFSRGARHFAQSGIARGPVGNPFRFPTATYLSKLRKLLVGLGLVILASLMYWLFFSSAFQVAKITVESSLALPQDTVQTIVQEQFRQFRFRILPQYGIFALDTKALGKRIRDAFIVDRIQIKKDYPSAISIQITEKPRHALWINRGRAYAVDYQGSISGVIAYPAAKKMALTIYDRSGGELEDNATVLSPQHMAFLSNLVQDGQIQGLGPEFFTIEKPQATEIALKINEGWRINLDLNGSLKEQLNNLELTLRNTVAPDKRATLDYIDLRFGEKVYLKYK